MLIPLKPRLKKGSPLKSGSLLLIEDQKLDSPINIYFIQVYLATKIFLRVIP